MNEQVGISYRRLIESCTCTREKKKGLHTLSGEIEMSIHALIYIFCYPILEVANNSEDTTDSFLSSSTKGILLLRPRLSFDKKSLNKESINNRVAT